MRGVSIAMFAAAALTAGAVHAAASASHEQSIVGTWYEDVNYGGQRVISVWTLKPDGTFDGLYRHCLEHGEEDTRSTGHWTYAEGHLRTVTEGGYWPVVDEYDTESNDGHIWIYKGAAGSNFLLYGAVRFRDIKVEPGSTVPACQTIS